MFAVVLLTFDVHCSQSHDHCTFENKELLQCSLASVIRLINTFSESKIIFKTISQ